ncbi:MAG: DUF2723 domain-containing protein [Candidatus Kapabacteria bacterium]|nr:DUF2723 domain-containing protein [Ignavibacteriota bacterium]MCW5886281.1 DUF2723 domain-containing protein [Candidatus Kapabacteria bacterium]
MTNKIKNLATVAIFIISLIVYIITLSPTVSFTDNGELAGVAYFLGVGHSSGYPLLALLGHIWTLIPTAWTTIYKLNLLSAIFTASSAVMFYLTLKIVLQNLPILIRISDNKKSKKKAKNQVEEIIAESITNQSTVDLIAFFTALGFSFSSLVWEQAVVFEVYSLQFLLINLVFYFLFKGLSDIENQKKYFLISGLFIGLSFSNHLTTILIIPALAYIFFKKPGQKFNLSNQNIKLLLTISLMILIGVSLYVYLPLRSAAEPAFNWGYVHRGFDKFLYHVQGKQYQVWMFSGMDIAIENFGKFLGKVPYNLAFFGLVPLIAGFIRLYKSHREYLWFFLILIISCILYSVNYSIHDIDVYFYLAIYAFLIITAVGFLYFTERSDKLKYAVIIFAVLNLGINFSENDKSDNYLVYDFTRTVVDNLGENAIIISAQWDYWNSAFWYLQKVENYRPDIILIERELLRRTWYPLQLENWHPELILKCRNQLDSYNQDLEKFESGLPPESYPRIQNNYENLLKCFIESNIDEIPIYVTFDYMNSGADASPLQGYNIVPAGFAFKLEKQQSPIKVSLEKLHIDRMIDYPKDTKSHLEKGILETASLNLTNMGRYAAATGDKQSARIAFEKALKIYPDNPTAVQGLRDSQ